nr:unnamed protein product [Spirometra erinaceieuropaei]
MERQLLDGMVTRVTGESDQRNEAGLRRRAYPLQSHVLLRAPRRLRRRTPGSCITYRIYGQLLDRRRMRSKLRVSTAIVHEFLFANDSVLNATSEGDKRTSMDLFSAACQTFELIIKMEKAVVMHRQSPNAEYTFPRNQVNDTELKTADNFAYPGSTMSTASELVTK